MVEREATSCEDIRQSSYPCFGKHKDGKQRSNQHATWMSCSRCGMRLHYVSKGSSHGEARQFLTEKNLLRATLEVLEQTIPPDECTEKIVQGKMMELKGQMLQAGVTNTMSMHLTYAQYVEKMNKVGPTSLTVPTLGPPPAHLTMPQLGSTATTPTIPKAMAPPAPSTRMTESDLQMETLTSENEALRARLEVAEKTAAEAIYRTERLAQEALQQKMDMERMAAQKMSRGSSPSSPEWQAIPSSGEENAEKKRSRAHKKEVDKEQKKEDPSGPSGGD